MPFGLSVLIVRLGNPLRVGEQCLCFIPNVHLSIKMLKDREMEVGGEL